MLAVALVFARVVLEPASAPPLLTDDAVLLVQRHGVYVGGCPGTDAGPDGGLPDAANGDGGTDPGLDAGVPDVATDDAGTDGGTGACETIAGDAVSMVVRPRFEVGSTGSRFALLFVTPSHPIVETVPDQFAELGALTAPKTEIHVTEIPDPSLGSQCDLGGGGCGGTYDPPTTFDPPPIGDAGFGDGGVGVEMVGPYEIVRAQPADVPALAALLDSFGYVYEQADLDAIGPYLERGYFVVAVRIAIAGQDQQTEGRLATLQLTWAGSELRLPAALGTTGPDGLTAYVAADGRYEFPAATVRYAHRTFSGETRFLTRNELIDTNPMSPDEDPVAFSVAGDPEYVETNVIEQTEHVPIQDCGIDCGGGPGCGCGECNAQGAMQTHAGVLAVVVALVMRPRRRRRRRRR